PPGLPCFLQLFVGSEPTVNHRVAEWSWRLTRPRRTRKNRHLFARTEGTMGSGLENEFATLHEIVKAAKIRLNPNIWDYLTGGTETETTLRRNRMALDS